MMAYVTVDIELNDVDTRYLLEELENRYLNEWQQESLLNLIRSEDKVKMDLFFKAKDRFSVYELEEMLKDKMPTTPIPKEQLSLPL